jgi:hypothetical protein
MGTQDTPSDPALLGTALHDIAELLINGEPIEMHHKDWTDMKGEIQTITKADIDECVMPFVEFAKSLDGDNFAELRVEVSDEVWGTSDLVNFNDGLLTIADLKTGYGRVDAGPDNFQLKIYALGALYSPYAMMYDIDTINTVISQGRLGHHSSYAFSIDEIREFEFELLAAVDRIRNEPDTYIASDKACKWCPARAHCPTLAKLVHEQANQDFKVMKLDDLAEALRKVPMMKAWIRGVEDQTKDHLERGDVLPGWKMVQGRRSRKWASEAEAVKYFKNRVGKFQHTCYNMKLKSPSQMEKALRAEDVKIRGVCDIEKVVVHGHSSPTIVPESDPRDALKHGDKAKSDFEGM